MLPGKHGSEVAVVCVLCHAVHTSPVCDADGSLQVQAGEAAQLPQGQQAVIGHMAIIVQVDVLQMRHAVADDLQTNQAECGTTSRS